MIAEYSPDTAPLSLEEHRLTCWDCAAEDSHYRSTDERRCPVDHRRVFRCQVYDDLERWARVREVWL